MLIGNTCFWETKKTKTNVSKSRHESQAMHVLAGKRLRMERRRQKAVAVVAAVPGLRRSR